ncbi:GntR family transcriptional regulator [Paroceanicella profunda]|uniref:GntR family transcriptional regulator n=2 Tax=Paroceanicella profunda TaxID=2579971 RepID=A0A5B8FXL2_9RHOB|nr:GntR family transcriptional regulator [Paroceanicella profunda]
MQGRPPASPAVCNGWTDLAKDSLETAPPVETVKRDLMRAILDHRLPPGTRLTEEAAAAHYGVGRTVVRTALLSLAHDGLVTIERNRGAFVARPAPQEAREVFEARSLLEPRAARLAAQRATPADIEDLRRHLREEHGALAAGDTGSAVLLSGQFHTRIAEIAAQETIASFVRALVSRSSLVIALYWRRRDTVCESHAHHELLSAIGRGDGAAAEELMQSHLVDLLSGLDLSDGIRPVSSLAKALQG